MVMSKFLDNKSEVLDEFLDTEKKLKMKGK